MIQNPGIRALSLDAPSRPPPNPGKRPSSLISLIWLVWDSVLSLNIRPIFIWIVDEGDLTKGQLIQVQAAEDLPPEGHRRQQLDLPGASLEVLSILDPDMDIDVEVDVDS